MQEQEQTTARKPNVLRSANFQLLFWGTLVSSVGAMLYSFAVSFYMLKISQNNAVLQGAYLAVSGVTFLLFSPLGGVMGDRWNKARVLVWCDYIKGALIILSAFVIGASIRGGNVTMQIVALFTLAVAGNVISAFFSPASNALLPLLVDDDQLQQANSYFNILYSFQSILGVVLAGILYASMDITTLFLVVGVCYVLSGFSEMFIRCRYEKPQSGMTVRGMLADFGHGLRYLRGEKAIVAVIFSALFINFFISPYYANGIPYFITSHVAAADRYLLMQWLTPEMWSGVFQIAGAVGGILMGVALSHEKPPARYGPPLKRWLLVMAGCVAVVAAGYYALVSSGKSLDGFLVLNTAVMFAISAVSLRINVPLNTVIQQKVRPDMLAKVSSLINIGAQGLTPLSSMVAGLLISAWGLGSLWAFCAAGFAAIAVITYFNKSIDAL